MSRTIDERVVEMRFDNKQFESATKQTLSTLDRLKAALKLPSASDAFSNIDKAAKNTSLNGIAASLEMLEKRFSTLGIVGMRVIENITDGLMNKLSSAVHYATDAIVSGGIKRAMNIENAHFQLQALLKDEAKVQEVMDDAMKSVDGTAYAFDEAAKAASQFAASGIQAGDEMLGALKGITGVAAMTNSSFEDISRIFTTVAGNGRLMGDQLLQLSSRGLNAASTLADYFRQVRGEADMTEAEIRDMVSHGKLDFRTFAEAMQWAFGESAERANETFTGALANMRSALARIGAGFISPFIEQESDLVKLFNALRIQINAVKAALVFDEQKSAISGLTKEADLLVETTSELLIGGSKNFDTFTKAILGTTKSEKELAEANEVLSASYEQVKENGSASVDTLIEFNKYGINATKSLREYLNGVMDGSIKASDGVREAVNEITGGVRVMSGDITRYAEEGKISYEVFTNAIVNSSGLVQKGSKLTTEAITTMLKKVEDQGFVTMDTLIDFNKNGVNATKALREYMNGVTDGSIRASYATTQAVNEITKGTKLAGGAISKLAEEGVISYDILQSALENMYGNQRSLSKEFTEYALDMIKKVKETVEAWDLSGPIDIFYHGVESVKNLAKGLYTVLKPLASSFKEVFLSFSMNNLVDLAAKVERMTSKLRLSEKQGENLRKTFKGLFDVAKLLVDIFIALIKVIIPINEPVETLGNGLLNISASIGESLTKFTDWVHNSPVIAKAYERVSEAVRKTMHFISGLIGGFGDFIKRVKEIPAVTKIINTISDAFSEVGKAFEPVFGDIGKTFSNFFKDIEKSIPKDAQAFFNGLLGDIERFANSIDQEKVLNFLTEFTNKVKKFVDFLQSNDGLNTFVDNANDFFDKLVDAFRVERIMEKIDNVQEHLEKFVNWVKDVISPFFEGFTLGGALAATGSGGLLYLLTKLVKVFEKWGNVFQSIPKAFNALKNVLVEYQKNLKADAILKIAKAIGILAVSLTVLSFADTNRLWQSVGALVVVGGLLITAFAVFNKVVTAVKKLPTIEEYIGKFANNIGKAAKQLGKAAKWKMIAKTITSVGSSILKIAISIVALGLIAQKNPEAIENGIYLVTGIAAGIGVMIYAISKIGDSLALGMQSFSKATNGVLAMCIGITIMAQAIKMLMKLELPTDNKELAIKLGMFGAAIFGIAVLVDAIGKASKTAEGNKLKMGPILATAVSIVIIVKALEMLMKIELGSDAVGKILIFAGIFTALGFLIQVIGQSAKDAGGALKATGTLLALSVAIIAIVGALSILTLLPTDKLFAVSIDLGIVLGMLAVALLGAGQITNGSNWKTILTIGIIIAALSVSLSLLSMIPWTGLVAAAGSLGVVLFALAAAFAGAGSIKTRSLPEIIAMMVMVGEIAYALYQLAGLPWDSLIAAGGALALSMVGVSAALFIVGKSKIDIGTAISFAAGAIALIPAAYALSMIAGYDWPNLIAAGTSLAIAVVGLSVALLFISANPMNLTGILTFVAGAVALIPVAYAIQMLSGLKFGEVVTGLIALAAGLAIIAAAGVVFGAMATPMIGGAIALLAMSASVAAAGVAILVFVWSVTTALDLLGEFIGRVVNAIGNIAEVGKNVVLGFVNGITGGLGSVRDSAKELAGGFIGWVKNIFGIHSPSDVMEAIASFVMQGFNIGIEKGKPSVVESVKGAFGGLADLVDTSSLKSTGASMATSFTDGIASKKDQIASLVKNVTDGKEIQTDTTVYQNAGEQASNSFGSGFMSGSYDIEAKIQEAMSAMGVDVDYSQYLNIGDMASGSFLEGFGGEDGTGLSMSMSEIMNGAVGDFDYSQYFDTGKEGGTQFLAGFESTAKDATQVSNEVIKALAEKISEFAKRQDMKEIGRTMVLKILQPFKESGNETNAAIKVFTASIKSETDTVIPYIISGIKSKQSSLISTIQVLCNDTLNRFKNIWNASVFNQLGRNVIQWSINGISSKRTSITNTASSICKEIVLKFQNTLTYTTFYYIGQNFMNGLINGIYSRRNDASNAVLSVCQTIVNISNSWLRYDLFYSYGQNVSAGLANGIASRIQQIANTAINAAKAAIDAVKGTFAIASPSKVMFALGEYVSQGLANGIRKDSVKVVDSIDDVSDTVLSKTSQMFKQLDRTILEQNLNRKIELTPVMNLSALKKDTETVNDMFNNAIKFKALESASVDRLMQARSTAKEDEKNAMNENQKSMETLLRKLELKNLGTKNENTFYIQGEDPKAIAEEVSTILNRQIERTQLVWGQ